jgi:hypothetical protein
MRVNQIEDLLDEFDFDRVKKVMDFLGWKYHDSPDNKVSIGELRRMARHLLEIVYHADTNSENSTACGGFFAERRMYPGDTQKYLNLKFVIVDGDNPCC